MTLKERLKSKKFRVTFICSLIVLIPLIAYILLFYCYNYFYNIS